MEWTVYPPHHWTSLMAQQVKNLPAMQEVQEMQVWPLGWEDPLEEGMATHSSILAWRTPWKENEMAGWHHWLDGHEFDWTQGVGDGQGGLACCDSWGRKESDRTERLIWSDLICESASFLSHSLVCCVTDIPHIRDIIQYLSFSDLFHWAYCYCYC